jgi:hypothetical protein
MLTRLLEILNEGGVRTLADLACELDVGEALVEQMLLDLTRLGYLQCISTECNARCAGCPMADLCAIAGSGRVWALTEAGRRAAQGDRRQ